MRKLRTFYGKVTEFLKEDNLFVDSNLKVYHP